MSGHFGHESLCVFALGRGPVGRVARLLCERMACLLAEICGLLLLVGRYGQAMCADVCLPRWRSIAGFGQTFFGVSQLGLELFEFGGFGVDGLLPGGNGSQWLVIGV